MGGATAGYALARAGKRVLFCEKGHSLLQSQQGLRGDYAESFFRERAFPGAGHRDALLQAGRHTEEVVDVSSPRVRRQIPFIGLGTGGSSALYGAALERFFPQDFSPRANHPRATDAALPEDWPIGYQELRPYYERAEALYRVRGSADPLRPRPQPQLLPPPPLRTASRAVQEMFQAAGLHPYRLPQACEFVEGCGGCQGFLCRHECKNDAGRICLRPALEQHGAALIERCDVLRLDSTHRTVTGVVCRHDGRELTLRGDIVLLAAGALATPRILLDSASTDWPQGLANESGLVGRNLMRHFVDLFAVSPPDRSDDHPGNLKELAFNDFYVTPDGKFGSVQSFGALPPPHVVADELFRDLQDSAFHWLLPVANLVRPAVRAAIGRIMTPRIMFASIMEDLPYPDNRVFINDTTGPRRGRETAISYRISTHERARIDAFRARICKTLAPARFMMLKQAENNMRIAHVSGTCRFGQSPADSVLDAGNRAHGIDNLFVIDASFFPSSGGTNPALTVAANALRVADLLLGSSASGAGTATTIPEEHAT